MAIVVGELERSLKKAGPLAVDQIDDKLVQA
jgi:hypothetical protein